MEAVSYATLGMVSVDNKGSAFAVDTPVKVKAELIEKKVIDVKGTEKEIAKNTAKKTLKFFNKDYGAKISVESKIPGKIGLGEKEAISVSTALATLGAVAKNDGSVMLLRIDKYLEEQFFIVDRKIVNKLEIAKICNGRFDRICSSLFGGFVVTENDKILRRGDMENLSVSVFPRKRKIFSMFHDLEIAWQEALKGNLYTAMRMNALILGDRGIIERLIKDKTLTVGVTDGSIYALMRDKKIKSKITAGVMNKPSVAVTKPEKIVKIREFLELKGEQEYYLL